MRNTRRFEKKNKETGHKTGIFRSLNLFIENNRIGDLLILKGYVSSGDLAAALLAQKETNKPLGQIFLEQSRISKYQLASLLLKQKAIRFAAAALLLCSSMGGVSKKAHAGAIKDVPARMSISSSNDIDDLHVYPALFGADEKRSTNLKAFTKWSDMFERFDANLDDANTDKIVAGLKAELSEFKSSSILDMAHKVNDMMNKKKYIVDSKNWGKSDYWATPVEFMARGGDCEDFAIAKYVALRALGVPENRMRIAIVQDLQKNIPHAILVVYSEKGAVILDNQIKSVRPDRRIAHYKPIFSINREAWWLHTTPQSSTNTIVAAAN